MARRTVIRPARAATPTARASAPTARTSTAAVRAWAREQGLEVNERGALPAGLLLAYRSAHRTAPDTTPKEEDVAPAPARKTSLAKERDPAPPAQEAPSAPPPEPPQAPLPQAPTPQAPAPQAPLTPAPPAGSVDLAGSLRGLLGSVDTEVRAVGLLSERIDDLVGQLNAAREEQATRLLVLDELRASVQDETLGAFLEKAVRPRRARVVEVFPERLDQD